MKKYLILLLLTLSLSAMPKFNLLPTGEGYQATIVVPEVTITETIVNEKDINGVAVKERFQRVVVPHYSSGGVVGAPELPVGIFDIAYEGALPKVSVTNVVADTIELENRLYPAQHPVSVSGQSTPFELNEKAYETNGGASCLAICGGYALAHLGETFAIRGQKGVQVVVMPVEYKALEKKLIVVKSFSLKIEMSKPTAVRSEGSKSFDKIIRGHFKNLGDLGRSLPSTGLNRAKESYLIIAADRFKGNSDLERFVSFRSATHDVEVVYLSEAGSSQSQLKSFIEGKMPSYLLFVGEADDFPAYNGTDLSQYQSGVVKTYLKYIDGGDNRPDIALGLFFVRTNQALTNIVNKTIDNQKNLDKMGMGYVCFGGHNRSQSQGPMTPDHIDRIFDDFEEEYCGPMGFDLTKVYAHNGPNKSDCGKVVETLNKGIRFLNYNGHGLQIGWNFSQEPQNETWGEGSVEIKSGWQTFTVSGKLNDFGSVQNDIHPFVISCACLTGQFAHNMNSWAETWIGNENLATTFIGSSELSFGNQHAMNAYLMEAIKDHDITTIGDMFVFAISSTFNTNKFSNFQASSMAKTGAEEYHLFGDPAIETMKAIAVEPAMKVTAPNGGEVLALGETYEITWLSDSDEKVSITLCNNGSCETIAKNVANSGSYSWDIDKDLSEGEKYKVIIAAGDAIDTSDAFFTIKKVNISDNLISFADWYVTSDEYSGSNGSDATLDTSKMATDSCIGADFSVGESDDAAGIWPWANLSAEPKNDFAGVTAVKVSYKADNDFMLTLDQEGLADEGIQYGYKLLKSSSFTELTIPISDFSQPQWVAEAKKSAPLDLSKVTVISFSPSEAYGKDAFIEVANVQLYEFKGPKEVALDGGSVAKGVKELSVRNLTSNGLTLTVPQQGEYGIKLYTLNGKEVYSLSTKLKRGVQKVSLSKLSLSTQIYMISIQGENRSVVMPALLR